MDLQPETQTAKDIWENGTNEFYLPLHTYHIRSAYDPAKIATFNENPWGVGFGKGLKDANGNWRSLYAMEFKDSHNKIEPIAGYGYLKRLDSNPNFHVNAGFTAFVTARQDIGHYTPIPGALPMASIEYKKTSVMATYLPGRHNNGNVIFFFMKVTLPK